MAQTGYTPILIYSSSTGGNAPAAGSLTNSTLGSELAINITDGKLFYKDNANAVQVIGWKTTPTTAGGTGLTSYTAGDLLYYATGTTLSKLAIGTNGQILKSTGSAPAWENVSALAVTSISFGTTGLTPSTATQGAVTVAGTLVAANGGTGQSSYTVGDILYASGSTTLSKLADVATGNALISGGVGVAPSWGKIGLTTHVSGTLGIANGGTNNTSYDANGVVWYDGSKLRTDANWYWDGSQMGIRTSSLFGVVTINSTGASGSVLTIGDISTPANAVGIYMRANGTGAVGFNTAGAPIAFGGAANGTSEWGRFHSSGGFSIGNTTDPGATNLYVSGEGRFGTFANLGSQVQVNSGTKNAINLWVSGASTDGTSGVTVGKVSTTNTSSQVFCEFWINAYNTASGRIVANGASAAAFASYSDRTLKENIVPLAPQLENINALKPCEFDYKDGSGHQIGFIAQDHQQVYPDDVSADDKGILSIVGWSKTEARLVSAIQQLSAQVTQLQAQVKALENK